MFVSHPLWSSDVTAIDNISYSVCGVSKEIIQCNKKIMFQKHNGHVNPVCLLAGLSPAPIFLPRELPYTYEIIHLFNRGKHMRHTLLINFPGYKILPQIQ